MYTDLFLTRNGDFSFLSMDTMKENGMFGFNFHIASSDSLLFNFSIYNNTVLEARPNQLEFDFYIHELQYNKIARTIIKIFTYRHPQ